MRHENYSTQALAEKSKPIKTRIACYERVSTEEQKLHGYSIPAQKEQLEAYCKKHGYIIVDHYTDEGISGGKPASKRPQMARLLNDIANGLIDLVLFCKLDRWFRNVTEYFKTQEVLDKYGVSWNAIMEDYETETANGRMTVTIMLSVAQNERERTSERIKAVFEYREAKGEYVTGGRATPIGYIVKDKHLVKDPATEPAIDLFFKSVLSGMPYFRAACMVRDRFPNVSMSISGYNKLLYSPIYAGIRNGKSKFCEPYITEADHKVLIEQKRVRRTKTHTYIFSGIMCCPLCGHKMTGLSYFRCGRNIVYYRCNQHNIERTCQFKKHMREDRIEAALMAFLAKDAEIVVDKVEKATDREIPAINAKEIESKMIRLSETYTDGLIDRDSYKAKLEDLKEKLETARNAPNLHSEPSIKLAREIVSGKIATVYSTLNTDEKKRFWMHTLQSATLDENCNVLSVRFFD